MSQDSVTYGMQYTRNLGNFENARIYFEVTRSVRDGETIDEAKEKVVSKVDGWVQKSVEAIDNEAAPWQQ
jgi:hypothetical protein